MIVFGAPTRSVVASTRAARADARDRNAGSASSTSTESTPLNARSAGSPSNGRPGKSFGRALFAKRGSVRGTNRSDCPDWPSITSVDRDSSRPTRYSKSSSWRNVSPPLVPSALCTTSTSFVPSNARARDRRVTYSATGNVGWVHAVSCSTARCARARITESAIAQFGDANACDGHTTVDPYRAVSSRGEKSGVSSNATNGNSLIAGMGSGGTGGPPDGAGRCGRMLLSEGSRWGGAKFVGVAVDRRNPGLQLERILNVTPDRRRCHGRTALEPRRACKLGDGAGWPAVVVAGSAADSCNAPESPTSLCLIHFLLQRLEFSYHLKIFRSSSRTFYTYKPR